jgi:uncharacterized protein (TIRG00374 family)
MKRWLIVSVQLGIGLGLIAFLLIRVGGAVGIGDAFRAAATNWPWLLLASGTVFLCILACAVRWQMLLTMQGLRLRFSRTLALYLIGQFFSSLLPGATSGDVVKAYYAAKEARQRKTEAVATVFIDRFIGLLALILFVVLILVWRIRFIWSLPQARLLALVYVGLLVAVVVGVGIVVKTRRRDGLQEASGWRVQVLRGYEALRQSLSAPGPLAVMMVISIANHAAFVVVEYALARAVGVPLSMMDCMTLFPIINAAGALPVAPGGLGTRDAAAVFLLGLVGVAAGPAMSISLLVYGVMLLFSLIGGVMFLIYAPAGSWREVGKPDDDGQ